MSRDPTIRPMRPADLALALDWAAAEGWNPGIADAEAFAAADPGGFLMAFLDDRPVACVSVVAYDGGFGFLGFYLVPPELRGRGLGLAIWNAGMARLGGRTVGLDGVPAQQANYARSGFALAHRNLRYGGPPPAAQAPAPHLRAVAPDLYDAVAAYDAGCFGRPRPAFLQAWLRPEGRRALAHVADGRLRGYGVVRACRDGSKIGPLFADDEAAADVLFRGLAAEAGAGPIYLDPPEPNGAAVALARRYGLQPCFETARMYRGPAPELPLSRIFGITTFELG